MPICVDIITKKLVLCVYCDKEWLQGLYVKKVMHDDSVKYEIKDSSEWPDLSCNNVKFKYGCFRFACYT